MEIQEKKTKQKSEICLSSHFILKSSTNVDNVFFQEFLPIAEGNAVKVYLYSLYLAQSQGGLDTVDLEKGLNLSKEEIFDAFMFWDKAGIVKIYHTQPLMVEFLPLNERVKVRKFEKGVYEEFNKMIQNILKGRLISPNEFMTFYNIIEIYDIEKEALISIAHYEVKKRGSDKISGKFIVETAKSLALRGIKSRGAVEEELSRYEIESSLVAKVFKEMGTRKKVEISDYNHYKTWRKMEFSDESILTAAREIKGKNPTIEKLNGLMTELYSSKLLSSKEIQDYLLKKSQLFDLAIKVNKAMGVYYQSLDSEVELFISKWVNQLGFGEETILEVAKHCFISSVRTLEGLDSYLKRFHKIGITTMDAFESYLKEEAKKGKLIEKILEKCGSKKNITSYDRNILDQCLGIFPENIVLFSASLAKDALNPLAYILSILKNWQRLGVQTIEDAEKLQGSATGYVPKDKKKQEEIHSHNLTDEEISSIFTKLENVEF